MAHRWRGAGLLQAQVRPAAFTSSHSTMLEGCRGGRRRGRRTMASELRRESTTVTGVGDGREHHRSWGRVRTPPELGARGSIAGVGDGWERRQSWDGREHRRSWGRRGAPPELGLQVLSSLPPALCSGVVGELPSHHLSRSLPSLPSREWRRLFFMRKRRGTSGERAREGEPAIPSNIEREGSESFVGSYKRGKMERGIGTWFRL
jgi:hypothetical protein